jgi:hypothetical protein
MRRLFQLFRSCGGARGRRPAPPYQRPSLEALEDRLPLSTYHASFGAAGQFGAFGWQGTQSNYSKATVTGHEGHSWGGKFTNMAPSSTDALSRWGRGDHSDTFTSKAGHEWSATGSRWGKGDRSDTFTFKAGKERSGTFTFKASHEFRETVSRCGKCCCCCCCCTVTPPPNPPASISGNIYVDNNTDEVLDSGDTGIAGVSVTLTGTDSQGNPVQLTTTTNASGLYSFTGLPAGTYTISQPATGFTPEVSNVGTVNGVTNGTVGPGGALTQIGLQAGNHGIDYNFGNLPTPA